MSKSVAVVGYSLMTYTHKVVSYLNFCAQWRQNSSRVRLPRHLSPETKKKDRRRNHKVFCLLHQNTTETMCLLMLLHLIAVEFFK